MHIICAVESDTWCHSMAETSQNPTATNRINICTYNLLGYLMSLASWETASDCGSRKRDDTTVKRVLSELSWARLDDSCLCGKGSSRKASCSILLWLRGFRLLMESSRFLAKALFLLPMDQLLLDVLGGWLAIVGSSNERLIFMSDFSRTYEVVGRWVYDLQLLKRHL